MYAFRSYYYAVTIALLALVTLSACTELSITERPATAPGLTALPAAPLASHRFIYDPHADDVVGVVQVTTTRPGDTLPDIARRFNLGYEEIKRANPDVDTWLPAVGTKVVLPTRFVLPVADREGIVINLAALRLFYFPRTAPGAPAEVITHPVGIGRIGWQTPAGETTITQRVVGPSWYVPASIRAEHRELGEELPAVVPPGADNPLGSHALILGWPAYLIHGTNKPYGVGMRSSHGCLRLYPEDIVRLFDSAPVGTPVTVVNQPYLLGRDGAQLVAQAYGPLADDARDWRGALPSLIDLPPTLAAAVVRGTDPINWQQVQSAVSSPRGVAVTLNGAAPTVAAAIAKARLVHNRLPAGATWDGETAILAKQTTAAAAP